MLFYCLGCYHMSVSAEERVMDYSPPFPPFPCARMASHVVRAMRAGFEWPSSAASRSTLAIAAARVHCGVVPMRCRLPLPLRLSCASRWRRSVATEIGVVVAAPWCRR